jgi:hypothetical protein
MLQTYWSEKNENIDNRGQRYARLRFSQSI